MKYFISIALSPEQYCIGIALTEWVTKLSKEYFISIALHSIALAHLHVIFNTNKILMQYCILLVLHYSIALASFFCLGEKELFFHTKREAWVCSGQYFISIIHVCTLLGNIQIILLNHACTHFLVFY